MKKVENMGHHSGADKERPENFSSIAQVYEAQQGQLMSFISRFIRRRQDVEDIAQESFVRAFKAEQEREIDHPQAYIYRVARNLALKHLTKKSNLMTSYIDDSCGSEVLRSEDDVERLVADREKLGRVKQAIADLPPQCQRVFVMRKVYGYSHKEIAQRLGISVSTVEKHVVSGLKRCRSSVQQQESAGQRLVTPDFGKTGKGGAS